MKHAGVVSWGAAVCAAIVTGAFLVSFLIERVPDGGLHEEMNCSVYEGLPTEYVAEALLERPCRTIHSDVVTAQAVFRVACDDGSSVYVAPFGFGFSDGAWVDVPYLDLSGAEITCRAGEQGSPAIRRGQR